MYIFVVSLLMFILPILSIITEVFIKKDVSNLAGLVLQWFLFWSIGIRLFTAGIHQILKPRYTLNLLSIDDRAASQLVKELGFANISIGIIAIVALFNGLWQPAAAICGSLFLLLSGLTHFKKSDKTLTETL